MLAILMLDPGRPENKQERALCVDRQLVQVRYLSSCDRETSAATANRRYAYLHQPSRPRQGRHVDGRRPRRWPMSKEATFPVYRDPETRYRKWQACATGPAAMQTVANKLWRLAFPSAVTASFAGCCCCCCPTCDVTGSASTTSCSAFTRFSARRTEQHVHSATGWLEAIK